jgi:N-acetyl-anhydromuramoyl-L-alanine amidase
MKPETSPDWHDGWWQPAHISPSPNFGDRPACALIDTIVLHSISLPPGQYGGPEVLALFANELDWSAHPYFQQLQGLKVSAHFFIRRTGEIIQCVATHHRAWHAGQSTWLERDNVNDYSVGIELEGLEGESFEAEQYHALARVCEAVSRECPITYIVGHEHIAPQRKQDPGAGFDWQKLALLLNWGLHAVAGLHRPISQPELT